MFAYFFFIVECDLTIMICLILPYKKIYFGNTKQSCHILSLTLCSLLPVPSTPEEAEELALAALVPANQPLANQTYRGSVPTTSHPGLTEVVVYQPTANQHRLKSKCTITKVVYQTTKIQRDLQRLCTNQEPTMPTEGNVPTNSPLANQAYKGSVPTSL